MRHIILGTAGHIDHGKSTLVKALTGVDPDRLKEEKERGITIDIGFAELTFPDNNLTVGIVDVPGHERLVRNMLAGAGGIDMVLLVIAADEGIMPQSREHLAICNLLRIKAGLIVITKSDLVEQEWLDLIQDEIREFVRGTFLDGSPVIPVSSRTGSNIESVRTEIGKLALAVTPKPTGGLFRLPIDRVFTLKGFGTVVTGTAVSGSLTVEDYVDILPAGIRTKVRGLHSHGEAIKKAYAGQRVAINLQAVEKESLCRGDVAVTPDRFFQTKTVNTYLELLHDAPDLKTKSTIHFYCGTAEVVGRLILFERDVIKATEQGYAQIRLKDPVVVMAGDRYIIRRLSPLETLGGGLVLDSDPAKRRRKDGIEDLKILYTGSLEEKITIKVEKAGIQGISLAKVEGWIDSEITAIKNAVKNSVASGLVLQHDDMLVHKSSFTLMQHKIIALLQEFHRMNPIRPGIQKEEIRTSLAMEPGLFTFILMHSDRIVIDKNLIRLKDFKAALTVGEEENSSKILEILNKSRFQPPSKSDLMNMLSIDQKKMSDILNLLIREHKVERISDSLYLSKETYDAILELVRGFYTAKNEMTVAEFRDLLDTSRKYALPLIEYLDTRKITLRVGDARKLISKI
ncbi:MAG: selenocysteine-specific translation elongation factor [Thermodesulfovibrio sp.]|nr:selenocysteine-specific translation elongation factor [Thermodesulfovibrio sp.]